MSPGNRTNQARVAERQSNREQHSPGAENAKKVSIPGNGSTSVDYKLSGKKGCKILVRAHLPCMGIEMLR